jgi:hypothetical protein
VPSRNARRVKRYKGDTALKRRYTVIEAAKALGVGTDAVRKRVARGTVEHEKVDNTVYVWLDNGHDGGTNGDGAELLEANRVSDEIGRLAYVVLQSVNRMQAKGSTIRIISPRDPEVAHELGMDPDEDVILTAVEYLLEQGYIVPAGIDLQGGAYTIAPAGLEWLDAGASGPPQAPRKEAIEPSEGTEPPLGRIPRRFQRELIEARKRRDRELIGRPWWHRWFGS